MADAGRLKLALGPHAAASIKSTSTKRWRCQERSLGTRFTAAQPPPARLLFSPVPAGSERCCCPPPSLAQTRPRPSLVLWPAVELGDEVHRPPVVPARLAPRQPHRHLILLGVGKWPTQWLVRGALRAPCCPTRMLAAISAAWGARLPAAMPSCPAARLTPPAA